MGRPRVACSSGRLVFSPKLTQHTVHLSVILHLPVSCRGEMSTTQRYVLLLVAEGEGTGCVVQCRGTSTSARPLSLCGSKWEYGVITGSRPVPPLASGTTCQVQLQWWCGDASTTSSVCSLLCAPILLSITR